MDIFRNRQFLKWIFSDIDPQIKKFKNEFLDYVNKYWIHNDDFPISMWNCWKRSCHLTNNGHEGYNSRLKREVKTVHPNPNKLLMHIKKELMITELTARKYDMGGEPLAVKKKYRDPRLEGRE